jgi:hypothetical protein
VLLIKQYERNSKQLNFILNEINVIMYSYKLIGKHIYVGFFNFYQPKEIGGGFLIFEWTLYCGTKGSWGKKKTLFTDYRCVFAFKILLLDVRHWHIRFHGDFNNISFNTISSTLCMK